MFVLFVDMKLKPGAQADLEKTYNESFRPAISQQPGFRGVELLRPNQAGVDGDPRREDQRLAVVDVNHRTPVRRVVERIQTVLLFLLLCLAIWGQLQLFS